MINGECSTVNRNASDQKQTAGRKTLAGLEVLIHLQNQISIGAVFQIKFLIT